MPVNRRFDRHWFFEHFGNAKTLALVGNAPNVLDYELGDFIDSFDVVCRVNKFEISQKYSRHIGTRTDLYATNLLSSKTYDELSMLGVKSAVVTRPLSVKYSLNVGLGKMLANLPCIGPFKPSFISEQDFDFLYESLSIKEDDPVGRNPSSGLTLMYLFLKHLALEKFFLIGFNCYDQSNQHGMYYFQRDSYVEDVTIEDIHNKYHPQEKEIEFIRKLIIKHENTYITKDFADKLGLSISRVVQ